MSPLARMRARLITYTDSARFVICRSWSGPWAKFGLGVIRPGYFADMLVLKENPLADVKVLYGTGVTRFTSDGRTFQKHGVKYTIRDGVVFDACVLLRGGGDSPPGQGPPAVASTLCGAASARRRASPRGSA